MDSLLAELGKLLAEYGIAGVVILYLIWDRYEVKKDNRRLQESLIELSSSQTEAAAKTTAAVQGLRDLLLRRISP